ncbi:MAG: NAD(P)/FAD-dependent oxidoreductase [Lachnospiraceae bacterium]|jgi:glycerol-3-phosphate dehydrogenase|nr:NAD(P)/FAD-dependent oxidoreductase [Lachnospiraceae bacterium]
MFDVLIVGCGVVGAAAAYQLSKNKLSVCVCERYNDVANGCTKANTAILHAGFDCPPGSLEARLNLRGIELAEEICEKLDVERVPMPTFIIAYDDPHELAYIEELYQRGVANGVKGVRIVDHDEALKLEPGLNPAVKAALYAPGSGIINPWEYCIAMAETAVKNGAEVKLESEVTAIEKRDGHFVVTTTSGVYEARYVVNAGGGWSAQVYGLVGGSSLYQTNFAGQYYILDKSQGEKLHSIVFPCPDEHGFKGICVTPTVHGNLLVGPDCYEVKDGDHVGTDPATLENLKVEGHRSVPGIDFREIIHEYAGVRPNTQIPDFVIGEAPECPHFINLAGIKSPGLSSAPAIAEELERILTDCGLVLEKKESWIDKRSRIRFRTLTNEEKCAVIQKDPLYGRIICRCETVTEGEIVEAIHRPIVPRTIDAIKRRCNAGMGRCQGGFCGPRVHEILARELGVDAKEILMDEQGTFLLTSAVKEVAADENGI